MTDATLQISDPLNMTGDRSITARRWAFFLLNIASIVALGSVMTYIMSTRGWSAPSIVFLAMFLLSLPWTLMGFWNALIGFVVLRSVADAMRFTNPALRITPDESPIVTRTAICLAVRHEDVTGVFARLRRMIDDIRGTPWAAQFDFHVLSDSARADIAAEEDEAFAALSARYPDAEFLHYRRRTLNTGYKAGNLLEFAERCQDRYDHMIVLDADSVMSARSMLRLVRAMQANPTLGILQSLVVGKPSDSAFTRIFQFGMRHSMRTQTVGSAWWQGPAGPYWGHNASLRVKPLADHCQLPVLKGRGPLGGQVLSHDQVEAAMMRGAGYDVRVIADELESWEENPPSLPDFIKRDLRWCQGNMQYLKLLGMPGLKPMGRFQLTNAIMMYVGAPVGLTMLVAGIAMAGTVAQGAVPATLAFGLYVVMMSLAFAPRFLGVLDVLCTRGESRRYGGRARLLFSFIFDLLFSLFLAPVMMVAQALFVIGLIFGRRVMWEAQIRGGSRSVPVGEAVRGLWPQTLFGIAAAYVFATVMPGSLPWALPTIVPCLVAVPFACLTASKPLGRLFVRFRICAIPDEYEDPAALRADAS